MYLYFCLMPSDFFLTTHFEDETSWTPEFPGLAGGSHHAFSPWLPEVGEGLRLLATSRGKTNTGTPMRPRKMPRPSWFGEFVDVFNVFVSKRWMGRGIEIWTLDLWLKAWGMFDVGCPYLFILFDAKVEAGEAEFCRSWSSSLRCEIILVVTGNVGNVDGGTWREKFQVICIIQKTIPLMDKLPETQLIWQAHLNIASSKKKKKDTF